MCGSRPAVAAPSQRDSLTRGAGRVQQAGGGVAAGEGRGHCCSNVRGDGIMTYVGMLVLRAPTRRGLPFCISALLVHTRAAAHPVPLKRSRLPSSSAPSGGCPGTPSETAEKLVSPDSERTAATWSHGFEACVGWRRLAAGHQEVGGCKKSLMTLQIALCRRVRGQSAAKQTSMRPAGPAASRPDAAQCAHLGGLGRAELVITFAGRKDSCGPGTGHDHTGVKQLCALEGQECRRHGRMFRSVGRRRSHQLVQHPRWHWCKY
jgi:hypothetical protein